MTANEQDIDALLSFVYSGKIREALVDRLAKLTPKGVPLFRLKSNMGKGYSYSVWRAAKALEKKGIIKSVKAPGSKSPVYFITDLGLKVYGRM